MAGSPEQLRQLLEKMRASREGARMRRVKRSQEKSRGKQSESRTAQVQQTTLPEAKLKVEKRVNNLRDELAEKLKDPRKPASKALNGVNLNNIKDEATLKHLSDFADLDPPSLQENPAAVHDLTDTLQRRVDLAKKSGKARDEIEAQAKTAAAISVRTSALIADNPQALDIQTEKVAQLVRESSPDRRQTANILAAELGNLAHDVPQTQRSTQTVLNDIIKKIDVPAVNQVQPTYEAAKSGLISSELKRKEPAPRVAQQTLNEPLEKGVRFAQAGGSDKAATTLSNERQVVVEAKAVPREVAVEKLTPTQELNSALNKLTEIKVITEEQSNTYRKALEGNDKNALHKITGEIYDKLPDAVEVQAGFANLMAATVKNRLPEESAYKVDDLVASFDSDTSTHERARAVKALTVEQTHADGALKDGVADKAVFYLTAQATKTELSSTVAKSAPETRSELPTIKKVIDAVDVVVDEVMRPRQGIETVKSETSEAITTIYDPKLQRFGFGIESHTVLVRFGATFERSLPESVINDLKMNTSYVEDVAPIKGGAPGGGGADGEDDDNNQGNGGRGGERRPVTPDSIRSLMRSYDALSPNQSPETNEGLLKEINKKLSSGHVQSEDAALKREFEELAREVRERQSQVKATKNDENKELRGIESGSEFELMEKAQRKYEENTKAIEALLDQPEDPARIDPRTHEPVPILSNPNLREHIERALGARRQGPGRQQDIQKEITYLIGQLPTLTPQEQALVSPIIELLQKQKEIFADAFDAQFKAVDEFAKLKVEIFEEKNNADLNHNDPVQGEISDLIYEAVHNAESKDDILSRVALLQDKVGNLSADKQPHVRRIIQHLRRQAELYKYAVREGDTGDYHYRQLGLTSKDIKLVYRFGDIENIIQALNAAEQRQPGGAGLLFEEMSRDYKSVMNKIFGSADVTPTHSFEESFSQLIEAPVYKQLANVLDTARKNYEDLVRRNPRDGVHHDISIVRVNKDGRVAEDHVDFSEALKHLFDTIVADRELREYGHNVRYILLTQGSLEDLANYSRRLQVSAFEKMILGKDESMVRTASSMALQETMKQLADNNYVMPSDLLNSDRVNSIEHNVKELLKRMYPEAEAWEIDRSWSIGSGVSLGVTASMLDIMAMGDPQVAGAGQTSYSGESVLKYFNYMRNLVFRWHMGMKEDPDTGIRQAEKIIGKLFHVEIEKDSHYLEGWDHRKLADSFNKYIFEPKVALTQTEDGVDMPVVQIVNFFKMGGLSYRRGWRYMGPLLHKLKPIDEIEGVKFSHNQLNWANIDLDGTYNEMKKAGSSALYWYVNEVISNKGYFKDKTMQGISMGDKEVKHKLLRQMMHDVSDRNPIYFLRIDPSAPPEKAHFKEARDSIRLRVLQELGVPLVDGEAPEIVHKWERDASIITQELVQLQLWSLADLEKPANQAAYQALRQKINGRFQDRRDADDNPIIGADGKRIKDYVEDRPGHFEDVIKYWRKIQEVIGDSGQTIRNTRTGQDIQCLDFFADQQLPQGFNAQDMDFTEFAWSKAGDAMTKRFFADMNDIGKRAIEPLFQIQLLLNEVNKAESFEPIYKYLAGAHDAIESANGRGDADEVCYKLLVVFVRYFDQSWYAQLPAGIGSILKMGGHASLAQEQHGRHGYTLDEQATRQVIDGAVQAGLIPEHEHTPDTFYKTRWNSENLKKELGATGIHSSVDVSRTGIPVILFLATVAGFKLAEDDTQKQAA